MEYISSRQNPKILEAVALKDRKNRKEKGLFFFEGKKLLEEAVARKVKLVSVFVREDRALPEGLPEDCRVFVVSDSVYDKLSEEKSPEGLFCIAKTLDKLQKFATIYNSFDFSEGLGEDLLMAVTVQDPGNLGTLIRTAAAFGFGGLILSADCADLYHPKTLRGSMGTLFSMPVRIVDDPERAVRCLQKGGYTVYGTALDREARSLPGLDLPEKTCFLFGNEGHGLPDELLAACDGKVFIPMTENAESLNVSAAAAVIAYSVYTKRNGK